MYDHWSENITEKGGISLLSHRDLTVTILGGMDCLDEMDRLEKEFGTIITSVKMFRDLQAASKGKPLWTQN